MELKTRVSILKERELSYTPKNIDAAEYFTQRKIKVTPNRVTYLKTLNDTKIIQELLEILNDLKGIQSAQSFTNKNRPLNAFMKIIWNGDIHFIKDYEMLKNLNICQIVSAKESQDENYGHEIEDLDEEPISKMKKY